MESIKASIEYAILTSNDGDYILQVLILADMNPEGW